MPAQKRGKSKQDYTTPVEFLDAVKKRFQFPRFDWDLAASRENAVDGLGPSDKFYGTEEDSLSSTWWQSGHLWLNPPFADIGPWAKKCAENIDSAHRIYLLVPASVGSNWYADHVHAKALVLFLNGRLTFGDLPTVYPKDCLLAVYGESPWCETWRWRDDVRAS